MVTGADQYSRADISDEKYLESQDKSKLLTFYLDSDMNEYFSDARLIAFHSEEEKPDFLASDTFETEGLTLTTARIPVNQKADGRTYAVLWSSTRRFAPAAMTRGEIQCMWENPQSLWCLSISWEAIWKSTV